MGIKMFCGELHGVLEPGHIGFRANEVRFSIAAMFNDWHPEKKGWTEARREGWRVVPVEVRKIA